MTETGQNKGYQGRIDLPLPAEESQSKLAGAVSLSAEEMATSLPVPEPAVLAADLDDTLEQAVSAKRMGLLGWGLLATLILSLWQLVSFVLSTLQESWLLGSLWLVALGALGLGGLRLIFRELRELYQLKRQQDWRSRAEVLLASDQTDGGRLFCQELARASGMANSAALAQWQQACQLHHSAAEQLTLYSHHLLSGQDERARAVILRWSSEAAVLVAISPLAVVDMLLILWRSVKMVDEVARCYGIRLGYWSRIRLFRLIARHMLYAGVSELVTDVGLDWLGAELTARLSTRIAQGLGAGLLTARLGLQTMQLCRPIPFCADEKPGLGQIRRQLLKTLGDKLGAVLTPKSAPQPEAVTIESEK